jgi:large subunit ribosomal protein L24
VDSDSVLVEGINRVKKHTKPNPLKGQPGGIVEKEMPLNISNIALFNASAQKGDRVGFKALGDGRKVRVFKSSGEVVDA